jgi:hypothetical protein
MSVGGQRHAPRKDQESVAWEIGWAPGPVWTGTKNLAPTGIRSPDRPARSESLYRLSYPGPLSRNKINLIELSVISGKETAWETQA